MKDDFEKKRDVNFGAIWLLYLNLFSCQGLLPAVQDNLNDKLPGTTAIGIGMIAVGSLIVGIISTLVFGYYQEKISEKYSRKKIFMITNLIWITCYFLCAFSPHFNFTFICYIIAAVGSSAFVPIGFSIIGDSYSPKERGKKYGAMQVALLMGAGWALILGALLGWGEYAWRIIYIIAPLLSLLALNRYRRYGIEPERGRSEIAFEDFEGIINYDYKITMKNVSQIFKKKSLFALLCSVVLTGIATSTLGLWTIVYFTNYNFGGNKQLAITLYIIVMVASIPGNVVGGKLGDKFYKEGYWTSVSMRSKCWKYICHIFRGIYSRIEKYC